MTEQKILGSRPDSGKWPAYNHITSNGEWSHRIPTIRSIEDIQEIVNLRAEKAELEKENKEVLALVEWTKEGHIEQLETEYRCQLNDADNIIAELEKERDGLLKFKVEFSPLAAHLARECSTTDGDLLHRFKYWLQAHNLEQQAKGVEDFFKSHEPRISMGKSAIWEVDDVLVDEAIKAIKDGDV